MTLRALVVLAAVSMCIVSCRSSKDTGGEAREETTVQRPTDPGPGVPPGHCRIVGTIVAVDPVASGDTGDPCSRVPCTAVVKIDEIVGYGSGFTSTLGKGAEIRIRFQYTLSPSADMFPKMEPSLPGLKQGSRFQADVRSGPELKGSSQAFVVGLYQAR